MTTGIRLNKMLSQAGIASRRGADDLIAAGRVRVNGKVMDKLGARVDPETDEVKVDGRAIGAAAPKVTILLNKPDNVVCTMRDPQGRTTVSDLLKGEPYKVRPVGRLDFHTEGVLLMTTDGELANRLLHPSHKVPKVYVVKVGGRPEDESIEALRNGVKLDDGTTEPAMVDVLDVQLTRSWLQLVLTQGKKRQVRRMCEAVGHRPLRVVRTSFSTLEVGKLRPGQFRYLTNEELDAVYNVARLPVERAAESGRAAEVAGRTLGEAWRRKGPLPGEEGWAARREEDEAWQGRERVDQDTRDRRGSPGGDRKPRGDDRKGGFRRDEREERQPRGGDRKGGFRRDDPDVRDGDRKPRSGGRAGGYQRGDRNDDRKPRSGGRAGGYQRDDRNDDRKPRAGGRAGGYQRDDRNDDRKPRAGGRTGGYQRDDRNDDRKPRGRWSKDDRGAKPRGRWSKDDRGAKPRGRSTGSPRSGGGKPRDGGSAKPRSKGVRPSDYRKKKQD